MNTFQIQIPDHERKQIVDLITKSEANDKRPEAEEMYAGLRESLKANPSTFHPLYLGMLLMMIGRIKDELPVTYNQIKSLT